jgi:sigma-B regulation protein RsbU (phosphoserine phosphatase)
MTFNDVTLNLQGSSLYFFSDGVTEGHVDGEKELGVKGLAKLIQQVRSKPPKQRLETIVARFSQGQNPLRDDITLLLIEDGCDH